MDIKSTRSSIDELRPLTHHQAGSQPRITEVRVCQEGTLLKHFFLVLSISDAPGWTTSFIVYEVDQLDRGDAGGFLEPVHTASRSCTCHAASTRWADVMSKRGKVITLHALPLHYSDGFTPTAFLDLAAQIQQRQHKLGQSDVQCRSFTDLVWRAVHTQVEVPLPSMAAQPRWGRISHSSRISDEAIAALVRMSQQVARGEKGLGNEDENRSEYGLCDFDIVEL
ncbi:hypothetical protein CALCODRAFT_500918 [Calocera cornea HHB12733]|uniref:Uncharacterized protein n=1 Tax=Calocera cornea HHB12733 TaxID=1353952 RepID=A0A165DVZ5_9BASI|nr:hypothetical protein CALCODRAFT_500918 [Calocera cornea HHB12733]